MKSFIANKLKFLVIPILIMLAATMMGVLGYTEKSPNNFSVAQQQVVEDNSSTSDSSPGEIEKVEPDDMGVTEATEVTVCFYSSHYTYNSSHVSVTVNRGSAAVGNGSKLLFNENTKFYSYMSSSWLEVKIVIESGYVVTDVDLWFETSSKVRISDSDKDENDYDYELIKFCETDIYNEGDVARESSLPKIANGGSVTFSARAYFETGDAEDGYNELGTWPYFAFNITSEPISDTYAQGDSKTIRLSSSDASALKNTSSISYSLVELGYEYSSSKIYYMNVNWTNLLSNHFNSSGYTLNSASITVKLGSNTLATLSSLTSLSGSKKYTSSSYTMAFGSLGHYSAVTVTITLNVTKNNAKVGTVSVTSGTSGCSNPDYSGTLAYLQNGNLHLFLDRLYHTNAGYRFNYLKYTVTNESGTTKASNSKYETFNTYGVEFDSVMISESEYAGSTTLNVSITVYFTRIGVSKQSITNSDGKLTISSATGYTYEWGESSSTVNTLYITGSATITPATNYKFDRFTITLKSSTTATTNLYSNTYDAGYWKTAQTIDLSTKLNGVSTVYIYIQVYSASAGSVSEPTIEVAWTSDGNVTSVDYSSFKAGCIWSGTTLTLPFSKLSITYKSGYGFSSLTVQFAKNVNNSTGSCGFFSGLTSLSNQEKDFESYKTGMNTLYINLTIYTEESRDYFRYNEFYAGDGTTLLGYSISAGTDFDTYMESHSGELDLKNFRTYNGKPVVAIKDNGFKGVYDDVTGNPIETFNVVKKVIISTNITEIGFYAFIGVSVLKTVQFEAGGTENLKIKTGAFASTSLTSITIPARVNYIGYSAFYITGLTSAVFETKEGWKAGSTEISPTNLGNASTAAGYLASTYKDSAWTRAAQYFKYTSVTGGYSIAAGVDADFDDYIKTNGGVLTIPSTYNNKSVITIDSNGFAGKTGITTLTIPVGITTIGEKAFLNCTGLTTIYYNATNVTSTNMHIFSNLGSSSDVGDGKIQFIVGKGVTNIPDYLFYSKQDEEGLYYYNNLQKVSFETGSVCSTIGERAFASGKIVGVEFGGFDFTTPLTEVTLPESITQIGEAAFRMTLITTITIPENVSKIGQGAFADCPYLGTILYYAKNVATTSSPVFNVRKLADKETPVNLSVGVNVETIPNNLFSEYNSAEYEWTINLASVTFLGNKCTTIGENAFKGCSKLTTITIPASVRTIGVNAFSGCSKLTSATIEHKRWSVSNGTTTATIKLDGYSTSGMATCLKTSYVAYTWTWVDNKEYFKYTEVYEDDILIGYSVAAGDDFKEYITNENGVLEIPETYNDKPVIQIAERAFEYSEKTSTIKEIYIYSNIQLVGKEAFYCLGEVTTIYVDAQEIGVDAFDLGEVWEADNDGDGYLDAGGEYNDLESITIGANVVTIGEDAFDGGDFTTVTFESGSRLEYLGSRAFFQCSFGDLVLGNNLETISRVAFSGCHMTTLTIPESVTYIGDSAFDLYSDAGLTTVYYNAIDAEFDLGAYTPSSMINYDGANYCSVIIGDSVKAIPEYLFWCRGYNNETDESALGIKINSITFGESLETIGAHAFEDDYPYYMRDFDSITIPASVTYIGTRAFKGCSIDNVSFVRTDGWTKDDGSYIDGLSNTSTAAYNLTNYTWTWTWTGTTDYLFPYAFEIYGGYLSAGTGFKDYIRYYDGVLTIPSEWNGETVIDVGRFDKWYLNEDLFPGEQIVEEIKEVIISEGIAYLNDCAFYGCSNLKKVTFPASLSTINYSFGECGLEEIVDNIDPSSANVYWQDGMYGTYYYYTDLTPAILVELSNNYIGLNRNSGPNYFSYVLNTALDATDFCSDDKLGVVGYVISLADTSVTSVLIPNTYNGLPVVAIYGGDADDSGFAGTGITSVTFGENIIFIGHYAFYNCTKLTSVTFNEGLTVISSYAFYNCTALTNINIPNSVTKIGDNAFNNCAAVETLIIGEGVKSFSGREFYGLINCKELYFNAINMSDLDDENYSYNLGQFPLMGSGGNLVFDKLGKNRGTDVYIGENVTKIPANLFKPTKSSSSSNPKIKSVTINSTKLNSIGERAFCYVSSLKTISFPESGSYSIGAYAFYNCKGLTEIILPDNVTSIGKYAFRGCSVATTIDIGDSVTSIGDYAFHSASAVTTLTIGEAVSYIGPFAFYGLVNCNALYYNAVSAANMGSKEDGSSSNHTFFHIGQDANDLTVYIGNKVRYLPNNLFYSSVTIGSVDINYINWGTASYSGATLNNPLVIGKNAFRGITSLQNDIFEDDNGWNRITEIGVQAFKECSFYHIKIGPNVKTIGEYAFANVSIASIITIGEKVKTIGRYAFYGITNCLELNFNAIAMNDLCTVLDEGKQENNVFYNLGKGNEGVTVTIGSNVTKIPANLFFHGSADNMVNIVSVNWGTGVDLTIGANAFRRCSNINVYDENSFVIGQGRNITIGDSAFRGCLGITKLTLGENVKEIAPFAFYGLKNCTELTFNAISMKDMLSEDDEEAEQNNHTFYHLGLESGGVTVTIGSKVSKIPNNLFYSSSNVGFVNITEIIWAEDTANPENNSETLIIGENAFRVCSSLQALNLPDKVTSIGDYAFYYCSSLKTIVIPDNVTTIGEYAFNNCADVESIIIGESVKDIGIYAFYWLSKCTELEFNAKAMNRFISEEDTGENNHTFFNLGTETDGVTVTIGSNVTKIPDNLFYSSSLSGHVNITKIIWENVDVDNFTIGNNAFRGCSALIKTKIGKDSDYAGLTLPSKLVSVGDYAFFNCSEISKINIPDKVTTIGEYAFANCTSVEKLIIGESVKDIGIYAFYWLINCNTLEFNAREMNPLTSTEEAGENNHVFFNLGTYVPDDKGTAVIIGSEVTKIPDNLFYSSSRLGNVKITSINWGSASYNGTTLKNPLVIGKNAFRGIKSLQNDIFKDDILEEEYNGWDRVTEIDYQAFRECDFTEILIGKNVSIIGEYAFYNCSYVTELTIGTAVKTIGRYAFFGLVNCKNLNYNAVVAEDLSTRSTDGGEENFAFFKLGTEYSKGVTVTIGSEVTYIPANIFFYNGGYGYVNIARVDWGTGKDLTIGANAFRRCSGLVGDVEGEGYNFVIGQGRNITIGDAAFRGCLGITKLTLGEKVKQIGSYAFYEVANCVELIFNSTNMTDLVSSDDTADRHNNHSFYALGKESGGVKLVIGESITYIPANLFYSSSYSGNVYITSIEWNNTNNLTIGKNAFRGCSLLTELELPDNVTVIGEHAFEDCSGVITLTIGKGVKDIGISAFSGLRYCETFNFNATNANDLPTNYYGSKAFDCMGINTTGTTLNIGEEVEKIPAFLFYNERGYDILKITTLNWLGNKCTEIGEYAFSFLQYLAKVTIPDSVTLIKPKAFYGCNKFNTDNGELNLSSNYSWVYSTVDYLTSTEYISTARVPYTDGNEVAKWYYNQCNTGTGLFYIYPLELLSYTLRDNDTPDDTSDDYYSVSAGEFFFNSANSFNDIGITSITIPETVNRIPVKSIGSFASEYFEDYSTADLILCDSIEIIEVSAFEGAFCIDDIVVSETSNLKRIEFSGIYFRPMFLPSKLEYIGSLNCDSSQTVGFNTRGWYKKADWYYGAEEEPVNPTEFNNLNDLYDYELWRIIPTYDITLNLNGGNVEGNKENITAYYYYRELLDGETDRWFNVADPTDYSATSTERIDKVAVPTRVDDDGTYYKFIGYYTTTEPTAEDIPVFDSEGIYNTEFAGFEGSSEIFAVWEKQLISITVRTYDVTGEVSDDITIKSSTEKQELELNTKQHSGFEFVVLVDNSTIGNSNWYATSPSSDITKYENTTVSFDLLNLLSGTYTFTAEIAIPLGEGSESVISWEDIIKVTITKYVTIVAENGKVSYDGKIVEDLALTTDKQIFEGITIEANDGYGIYSVEITGGGFAYNLTTDIKITGGTGYTSLESTANSLKELVFSLNEVTTDITITVTLVPTITLNFSVSGESAGIVEKGVNVMAISSGVNTIEGLVYADNGDSAIVMLHDDILLGLKGKANNSGESKYLISKVTINGKDAITDPAIDLSSSLYLELKDYASVSGTYEVVYTVVKVVKTSTITKEKPGATITITPNSPAIEIGDDTYIEEGGDLTIKVEETQTSAYTFVGFKVGDNTIIKRSSFNDLVFESEIGNVSTYSAKMTDSLSSMEVLVYKNADMAKFATIFNESATITLTHETGLKYTLSGGGFTNNNGFANMFYGDYTMTIATSSSVSVTVNGKVETAKDGVYTFTITEEGSGLNVTIG